MAMSTLLREMVYVRSRGYCEHCGQPLGASWHLHHRRAGGLGGTSRDRDVASNLLALLPHHHNLVPDSVHMTATLSRQNGWLISQHDARPFTEVPVLLWGGRWVLLDDAGGFATCQAAPAPLAR